MALPSTQIASQFLAHLNKQPLFELTFCKLLTFVKFQTLINLINQCFTSRCFELLQNQFLRIVGEIDFDQSLLHLPLPSKLCIL